MRSRAPAPHSSQRESPTHCAGSSWCCTAPAAARRSTGRPGCTRPRGTRAAPRPTWSRLTSRTTKNDQSCWCWSDGRFISWGCLFFPTVYDFLLIYSQQLDLLPETSKKLFVVLCHYIWRNVKICISNVFTQEMKHFLSEKSFYFVFWSIFCIKYLNLCLCLS